MDDNPFTFNRYSYANNNPYKYTDPNGEFANLAVGFVAGAGLEVLAQTLIQGKSLSDVDLSDVAVAGVVGALSGGASALYAGRAIQGAITASQAVAKTAVASAAFAGAGSAAESVANGETPNAAKIGANAAAGLVGGAVAAKIGNSAAAELNRMADAGGVAATVSATTQATHFGSAASASTSTIQGLAIQAVDAGTTAAQTIMDQRIEQKIR